MAAGSVRYAIVALLLSTTAAFSPMLVSPGRKPSLALLSARQPSLTALRMADPLYEDDSDGEVAKKAATPSSRQGGVSDAMRAKLLKENSALGGDPDAPSINFALVIGGIIATLLILANAIGAI